VKGSSLSPRNLEDRGPSGALTSGRKYTAVSTEATFTRDSLYTYFISSRGISLNGPSPRAQGRKLADLAQDCSNVSGCTGFLDLDYVARLAEISNELKRRHSDYSFSAVVGGQEGGGRAKMTSW
jgi:hypothetical protein